MHRLILLHLIIFINLSGYSQSYPSFGQEIPVTITGLSFDAMEPFISPDGNTLFFNNLNDGINTRLYYANKINDSTFSYTGEISGTNQSVSPYLDAVASLDSSGHFFWVSTRDYPAVYENLHTGMYSSGNVTAISRVYGNFNIPSFGWLIMDASIDFQGNLLYYCNAYFDFINNSCGAGIPCEGRLGIAEKTNDSTFTKSALSDSVFKNINDTNYIIYAPQISRDGLELYFTRFLKNTVNTEICVSVRGNTTSSFSYPALLHSKPGYAPEAPSLSSDAQCLYYHQYDSTGIHRLFLRYRNGSTLLSDVTNDEGFVVYPNPANGIIHIFHKNGSDKMQLELQTVSGVKLKVSEQNSIDISGFPNGVYILLIKQPNVTSIRKIIKES